MRDGSATEEKILKLAKKMIIKNGIANLDMKVLAEKIGFLEKIAIKIC